MDRELVEYLEAFESRLDRRFEGIDRRFEGIDRRFDGMDQRFERVEEQVRHTNVVVEDNRSQIKLVAEVVAAVQEQQERHKAELEEKIEEVRSLVVVSHRGLDRRVRALESRSPSGS